MVDIERDELLAKEGICREELVDFILNDNRDKINTKLTKYTEGYNDGISDATMSVVKLFYYDVCDFYKDLDAWKKSGSDKEFYEFKGWTKERFYLWLKR